MTFFSLDWVENMSIFPSITRYLVYTKIFSVHTHARTHTRYTCSCSQHVVEALSIKSCRNKSRPQLVLTATIQMKKKTWSEICLSQWDGWWWLMGSFEYFRCSWFSHTTALIRIIKVIKSCTQCTDLAC